MRIRIFLLFFGLLSSFSFSQKKEGVAQIQYFIEHKIPDLKIIDSFFFKNRTDEILLKILVKKSKENSYLEGEFYGSNALGRYYRDLSLFDKSLYEYNNALLISRKKKDTILEIKTLNAIGSIYRRQDDIKNALIYHQKALDKATTIKNPKIITQKSISIAQNSIGNIYLSLKQYELAFKEFTKAMKIQKELGHTQGIAINHKCFGDTYLGVGNLDEALKNYRISLNYNRIINSKIGKVICGFNIANVLIKQKKYTQALTTVDTILHLAIEEKDKYYLSNTFNTLGLAQLHLNKLQSAKKNLTAALDIAKKFNIHSITVQANEHLSSLYAKKGEYKKAFSYYRKSKEENLKTLNDKNLLYVGELITKYDKERSENKINYLAKKNQIAQLQITKNRTLWIIAFSFFTLIAVMVFSFGKQKGLQNEKRILSLKQDALRSQMNPHFMFNALNSIKLYIIENDQLKATYYLNKFSKLMRKILEASAIQETTLAQEIKTMELYLSIENIRFSNEIDFSIKTNANLNLEEVKIPPLVLQPFLENSIWHGLSTKEKNKKLMISIDKISSNYLQIDIEDNGIGRKGAEKIKAKKSINRTSMGVNLTKDRLTNFVKQFNNDYSIIYKDLKDKKNKASGTKVSIKLPLS
jgi:LytS/YehU family sensor histidine kinase